MTDNTPQVQDFNMIPLPDVKNPARNTEQSRRLHRCSFIGMKGITRSETEIRKDIDTLVREAIADGFTTFITGMSCGFEMWAGEAVTRFRRDNPSIHLIAAVPFPGFEGRWSANMQIEYNELLRAADVVRYLSPSYSSDAYQRREEWMIDHSARIITIADCGKSIDYARMLEVPIVTLAVA